MRLLHIHGRTNGAYITNMSFNFVCTNASAWLLSYVEAPTDTPVFIVLVLHVTKGIPQRSEKMHSYHSLILHLIFIGLFVETLVNFKGIMTQNQELSFSSIVC